MPPVITLTTDFGPSSPYVAAMKGVILSINPAAVLIDISHAIPPQDIRAGAIVLEETTRWFPAGTIHVAVVDPGVGSERKIVYAQIGEQCYVAPDNGLLSRLALAAEPSTIVSVAEPQFWLPQVSKTFHGRDIMAPVAARLSLGLAPLELGPRLADIERLFGNLVTDITEQALAGVPRGEQTTIHCDDHETQGIFSTYSDQPEMTLIALIGSSGKLELAIVGDSAALMLGVRVGTPVIITW
jgi:S-adenosylmethionine hydrolase